MRLINSDQLVSHFVDYVTPLHPLPVGAPVVVSYLSALSKEIFSNKICRKYPDLITFGYFCRKSFIQRALANERAGDNCFGWGNAIHIAPSNVPVNFAFSFVFGLLSGNSNLVRLPSSRWPQVDLLTDIFEKIASLDKFSVLKRRNAFVRTERDDLNLNAVISKCDALIVWGGDSTVATFRKLPKKPRCVELYFPDRTSSLVLNSIEVNNLSEPGLSKLARSFFNDTYLVDSNACSSPRKIFWVGDQICIEKAKAKFWVSVNEVLIDKNYELNIVAKLDKYLDVLTSVRRSRQAIPVKKFSEDIWLAAHSNKVIRGRLGRFNEASFETISGVLESLEVDEQTLTYYGFSIENLREFVLNSETFVDRIVPIGTALDIGFNWDGVDVIQRLSRKVTFV